MNEYLTNIMGDLVVMDEQMKISRLFYFYLINNYCSA